MIGGWGRTLNFSVRSRDWRYILCENGEEELYDHRSDPHEWTNLAEDARFAEVKNSLRKHLMQLAGRNKAKSSR
jgi:arylsulfatase A-like enzyme